MIARENAALQKRSLEITERLFKGGYDSELDVQQALAQYLGTLATIPQFEAALRQTQNALSTLLARPPGPLPEMDAGKDVIPFRPSSTSSSTSRPICCAAARTSARPSCCWPPSRRSSA